MLIAYMNCHFHIPSPSRCSYWYRLVKFFSLIFLFARVVLANVALLLPLPSGLAGHPIRTHIASCPRGSECIILPSCHASLGMDAAPPIIRLPNGYLPVQRNSTILVLVPVRVRVTPSPGESDLVGSSFFIHGRSCRQAGCRTRSNAPVTATAHGDLGSHWARTLG